MSREKIKVLKICRTLEQRKKLVADNLISKERYVMYAGIGELHPWPKSDLPVVYFCGLLMAYDLRIV